MPKFILDIHKDLTIRYEIEADSLDIANRLIEKYESTRSYVIPQGSRFLGRREVVRGASILKEIYSGGEVNG